MAVPDGCLYVVSTRDDGRIVLSESDDRHPTGVAWIANSERPDGGIDRLPSLVYRTPAVQQRIVSGAAVEMDAGEAEDLLAAHERARAARAALDAGPAVDSRSLVGRMQTLEQELLSTRQELRDTQQRANESMVEARARTLAEPRPAPGTQGAEMLEDRLKRLGGSADTATEPSDAPPDQTRPADSSPVGMGTTDQTPDPGNDDATNLDRSKTFSERATKTARSKASE